MEKEWYKIDNAGTYYASLTKKKIPTVFRFSATLKDPIEEKILDQALERTIALYPNIHVSLRAGLFWYYLETSRTKIKSKEDNGNVCKKIHLTERNLLYRVTYYDKRINIEVSHILGDGRGILEVFKTLINNYIMLKYRVRIGSLNKKSTDEESEDAFDKFYKKMKRQKNDVKNIYHYKNSKFSGTKTAFYELHMNTNKVLNASHKYNSTVTVFLTSLLIYSFKDVLKESDKKKKIKIDIPVDLRGYFNTHSIRNFFGIASISYKFREKDTFEDVLLHVTKEFKNILDKEKLSSRSFKMEGYEKLIAARLLPLTLKDIGLHVIDNFTKKLNTTMISNVGKVSFGEYTDKYVENISVLTSTENFQFVVASFKDDLSIGISSRFKRNRVIKNFIRLLEDNNIDITVNMTEV